MDPFKKIQQEKINQVINFTKEKLPNRKLLFISFFGSQKYQTQTIDSDFDVCVFVTPTIEEYKTGRIFSLKEKLEDIDIRVFDIRMFLKFANGSSFLFLELIKIKDTDYFSKEGLGLKKVILENNRLWANERKNHLCLTVKSIIKNKLKAIERNLPSTRDKKGLDKVNFFGFDPKQLSQIVMFSKITDKILLGENPLDCIVLTKEEKKELLNLKNNKSNISKEKAIIIGKSILEKQKTLSENVQTKKLKEMKKLEKIINKIKLKK